MLTYKEVLKKKAFDIYGNGAPEMLQAQNLSRGTGTSFDKDNSATKGMGYVKGDNTLSPEAQEANKAWAQGFYNYLANPESGDLLRNVRNGANGLANAFVWGMPRFAAGMANIGADIANLPANLWGLGNYALGGAGKPLYQAPKINTDNWHSTWFGADPASGQAGAVVGQLGLPAAAATGLRHVNKLRSMAKYRKQAPMMEARAWRNQFNPTPEELARARQVQQLMKLPNSPSDFASKEAYIKHLQQLNGKHDLARAYIFGRNRLRDKAYNQIAAKYGYKPLNDMQGIYDPQDFIARINSSGSNKDFYNALQRWEDAHKRIFYAPGSLVAQPGEAKAVLRAMNETQLAPNTTLGKELRRFSRGNNQLLFKGWRNPRTVPEFPGNLQHHLQTAGPATSNRWFGGLPQTSLSPSYTGKGGNFAIIQVPRKNSPIQRLRQRFQPHLGASVPAGSSSEVYEALRTNANPRQNIGHYAIGASPQYQFVATPAQWQKIPRLKHKVYILGNYKGNQVSNFRRLSDPVPKQVADIPLTDPSKPFWYQKNPKYWYNTPFLKETGNIKDFAPSMVSANNM